MTRKRCINLMRAICTEIAKDCDNRNIYKGWESNFRSSAARMREKMRDTTNGKISYDELFKPFKPLAHKYGIGGY